jgi:hypothetical protein
VFYDSRYYTGHPFLCLGMLARLFTWYKILCEGFALCGAQPFPVAVVFPVDSFRSGRLDSLCLFLVFSWVVAAGELNGLIVLTAETWVARLASRDRMLKKLYIIVFTASSSSSSSFLQPFGVRVSLAFFFLSKQKHALLVAVNNSLAAFIDIGESLCRIGEDLHLRLYLCACRTLHYLQRRHSEIGFSAFGQPMSRC